MIDRSYIGKKFPPFSVEVEKFQLRLFAKAVGERNKIYTDEVAAVEGGYSSLPAPPTFGFSLALAKPDMFETYQKMGMDLSRLLHGEQQFDYVAPIMAGDVITFHEEVEDIFHKAEKKLEFVVFKTELINQHQDKVGEMTTTLIVRN